MNREGEHFREKWLGGRSWRIERDTLLLRLFGWISLIAIVVITLGLAILGNLGLRSFLSGALASVEIGFFVVGILSFYYHRRYGIVDQRRVRRYGLMISLGLATLVSLSAMLLYSAGYELVGVEIRLETTTHYLIFMAGSFLATLVVFLLFAILSFGVVGVLSALERRYYPLVLRRVQMIEFSKNEPFVNRVTAWVFHIPYVLETNRLRIGPIRRDRSFPRTLFRDALILEVIFGIIVAVYISLNPFLLDAFTLEILLGVLSGISVLIPLLVIPWYAFHAINARIEGPKKDFSLFTGIRSRAIGAFVAAGSAVIFFRLVTQKFAIETLIDLFLGYIASFMLLALMLTFVYFNYFQNELAADIATGYREIEPEDLGGFEGPNV